MSLIRKIMNRDAEADIYVHEAEVMHDPSISRVSLNVNVNLNNLYPRPPQQPNSRVTFPRGVRDPHLEVIGPLDSIRMKEIADFLRGQRADIIHSTYSEIVWGRPDQVQFRLTGYSAGKFIISKNSCTWIP